MNLRRSLLVSPLRHLWGANFLLTAILVVALALRLYGIDWDQGYGFHPDERSFYMRASDMLCLLTAGPETDGPHCSAAHLRSLLSNEHLAGIEPGVPNLTTALSAERSPLNPRWFPLGSVLIYALVLARTVLEPFVDWGALDARFAGRTLAALADVGSVWLLYLIGRRMYGRWTGILAAALTAFAVIHIQHTQFYRPEPFTVLASLAAFWAMLRFLDTRRIWHATLLGLFVGLAIATKVSVAPILAPLALTFLWVAKDRAKVSWSQLRPRDIAGAVPLAAWVGAAALAAFFLTTPYAILDFSAFIADVREQAGMAGEAGRFPFTWQYADTPAFTFQIRQTAVWGLGLPLGILAWLAAPVTAWFAWRGGAARRYDLMLLAWAVPAFVFLELFEVKFLRYVFPLMPFYILMAARLLVALVSGAQRRRRAAASSANPPDDAPFSEEWHATPPTVGDDLVFDEPLFGDEPLPDALYSEQWHATPPVAGRSAPLAPPAPPMSQRPRALLPALRLAQRWTDRWTLPLGIALVTIVVAATILYAFAFVSVYGRPHTAVAAADWINANVPPGSSIVNGGSNWEERVPNLYGYDVWTFPAYHWDRDPNKMPELIERLANADYVIFYSNRAYGSVARLPDQFPDSSRFFKRFFAGELGFGLERAFTSYPSIFGVHLRDDPYGRAGLSPPPLTSTGTDGQPDGVVLNLGYADENVVAYDHPQVLIFRNVERLSEGAIRERIYADGATGEASGGPLMLSPSALREQQSGGTWSDLFDRDGWSNRAPWLAWLLAVQLSGLIAFPFTWWLMRPLPDRGILLARALGLLLVAWVSWWLVSAGILRYSTGTIWLAMAVLALPSAAVLYFRWRAIVRWLSEHWRLAITGEALFLLAYLGFVWVRAANPDLWHPWRGGEKPMELAYFTAVARSSVLPPYDPWFSGGYLNYYYWGYFILSIPLRITGIPPATGFNVAVPLLFALTATGAGSLAYNLVATVRKSRPKQRIDPARWAPNGAVVAGLVGAVMVAVSGNLDGALQAGKLALAKLEGMPAALSSFDFWRSSRAIPQLPEFEPSALTPWIDPGKFVGEGFHITEFPFFTFLFADLHAHMMTMPFALLAMGLGFSTLLGLSRASHRTPWVWATVMFLAVAVGSLWAINSWEYPAYALLMLGCIGASAWMMPASFKTRASWAAGAGLLALAVSYLAFLPFHSSTETFGVGIEPTRWRTPLSNYWLIHALPLLAAAGLLIATLPQLVRPLLARVDNGQPLANLDQWLLAGAGLGALLAGYFLVAGFATAGFLTMVLTLVAWALVASLAAEEYPERRADVMALMLLALALAIGVGVDLIRVEGDIARMNTLFKYYLVAWLLFGLSGAYGLWRGWTALSNGVVSAPRRLKQVAVGIVMVVFVGTLVYPALATPVRIHDRFDPLPPTLDGAAWMSSAVYHPPDWCVDKAVPLHELRWDYEAIRWLQDNVPGTPVALEAHSSQYCWNSRISQYTGLPTVLGWPWHQQQQRNDGDLVRQRAEDVSTIYNTGNQAMALDLLRQYRVAYIVVGQLERGYYDEAGIAKFDAMVDAGSLALAYANDGARVYQTLSP